MTYNIRGQRPRRAFPKKKVQAFSDLSKFINKAVVVEKPEVFVPTHKFADFAFSDFLKKNIASKGYETPTPIQDQAIPIILEGKDIVGIANTGTGKTAAFLLPLIDKVLQDPNQKILIVAPVRELAFQINEELKTFAKGSGLFSAVLIGGASMGLQIRELRHKNSFIIGTPGRIKDHIEQGTLNLSQFQTIVLDEADRMLDMGFIGDMRFLMEKMSPVRHTLFFSATLSSEIEKLIHEFLKSPVRISVKTQDTAKNIDQDVVMIKGRHKLDVLKELLTQEGYNKTIVFSRTKHGADKIAHALSMVGISASAIHGNKQQNARQRTLDDFKRGAIAVLVATDVAARGLDISEVSHVINFDLPATYEDYVHRIGRTGRAESKGKALTFID